MAFVQAAANARLFGQIFDPMHYNPAKSSMKLNVIRTKIQPQSNQPVAKPVPPVQPQTVINRTKSHRARH
jgi:hypothetical protein